ncbi:MAG: hypothetical protein IPP73_18780 [Chitinophagaceae bacterium]|nr:hypothetical protein [Chitinophagaceae bacterium]
MLFSTLNLTLSGQDVKIFGLILCLTKGLNSNFKFHLVLADSYVTRKKAEILSSFGVSTSFYKHFNVRIVKRIFYRLADKLRNRDFKTLPWYNYINLNGCDLVLFNVAGLTDLVDLYYPMTLCKKKGVPYWIILQQGQENYFLHSQKSLELVSEVSLTAKRFIFIAKKNQMALERALATKLKNAFYTTNSLVPEKIKHAKILSSNN